MTFPPIKSVAIIGAGASGAAAAAALAAEQCFDRIRVFERRETPGGTWIYDPGPRDLPFVPGAMPPDIDPPLAIPDSLPRTTAPSSQERFDRTPIYDDLTTNVPDIAMSLSDIPFPYGPFTPHWVPQQYISNYFSAHKTDSLLALSTTVEDLSRIASDKRSGGDNWKLVLRRHDAARNIDVWWEERFDAVVLANGHYSVPIVPHVAGLDEYLEVFPGRVSHSKTYRNPDQYRNKKVVVIGNSASGHDITAALVGVAQAPIYQSRRSRSRWDGPSPPNGIEWKPIIKEFRRNGDVVFEDGSKLSSIDAIIYCTGYGPSFPFWNANTNGGPIYDYVKNGLIGTYQHTFFEQYPNLGIIGLPRVLTFRSFEYQAIALARIFARRNALPLPPREVQQRWEKERWELVQRERRKFHDIPWENGETMDWLRLLFETAGLPLLEGQGKCPPVLGYETRWAIEHIKKYPDYGDGGGKKPRTIEDDGDESWVFLNHGEMKDSLHFI